MAQLRYLLISLLALGLLAACGDTPADEAAAPAQDAPAPDTATEAPTEEAGDDPEAEPAGGYFEGETLTVIIRSAPGGGFDDYARMVGPYLAEEVGADVVFENMPGAGGLLAMNEIVNVLPADCMTIGIDNPRATISAQVAGEEGVRFDIREDFNYLGRMAGEPTAWLVGQHTGYTSVEDVLEVGEFRSGAQGLASTGTTDALALAAAFDLEWDAIVGFDGTDETRLAVERGELDGIVLSISAALADIDAGNLIPIMVLGVDRNPDWPDVPALPDVEHLLADDGMQMLLAPVRLSEVGRAFMVRAGCPDEALQELRDAHERIMENPDLLAESEERANPLRPLPGAEMDAFVAQLIDEMPPEYIEMLQAED